MKLIGKLKEEIDNIDTKEGKRDAIKNAGILLTDDELEMVSGGYDPIDTHTHNKPGHYDPYHTNNSGNGSGNNNGDDSEGSGS